MDPNKNPGGQLADEAVRDAQKRNWDFNLTTHTPSEEGMRKMDALRSAAKALKDAYIDLVPAGREQSLALTSLEQANFYAIGGVARYFTMDNSTYAAQQNEAAASDEAKSPSK